MKLTEKEIAITTQPVGADSTWEEGEPGKSGMTRILVSKLFRDTEFGNVFATFLTSLTIFGIYLVQGIIVARILGPAGRGELGTAMFFPRDVFLYAGLLGGIEIVNSYAVQGSVNIRSLKYSAAKLGLISGTITGLVAAVVAVIVMVCVGKSFLIPFCLFCCLFVPLEHIQLTISAVDRGSRNFRFYNTNRLLFALAFVVLVVIVFGLELDALTGLSPLPVICGLFVLAKVIGLCPTLRGMNIVQTLFARSATDEAQMPIDQSLIDGQGSVNVPSPWTLFKNGRFYALSVLASESFEKLDIFLIVAIASVTESGYYFVAVPAAQLLIVAPNALGVFTFNAGADKTRRMSLQKVVAFLSVTAILQIISALMLAVLIPILIIAIFKEPFRPAIPFALWLLPACAIKGYLQAVDGYLKGRGKLMVGVRARVLSIFVMLGSVGLVYSNWIPGPEHKLLSIPMAACLGQAVSMIIISVAVVRDTIECENSIADAEATDVRS